MEYPAHMKQRRACGWLGLGWAALVFAVAVALGCASAAPTEGVPTMTPTLPPFASPLPTQTPVAAHATANALLLTAVALENRGGLPQALDAARTALVVATSQ